MTSKLRRAPLFTYNDMGTRCLAASFAGGAPPPHPGGHHPGGHHPGGHHTGGPLPAHPAAPGPGPHPGHHTGHHPGHHTGHHQAGYGQHGYREAPPPPLPYKKKPVLPAQQSGLHSAMECGVAGSLAGSGAPSPLLGASLADRSRPEARPERSPAKHGLHVNFTEKVEVKERREKFLTAKYGSHQMALIRKRLAVEMWLYDELQKLYESTENNKNDEVDVDIDELLDMDDDNQRRIHLQRILADAKKSSHDVKKFVEDLLERTKTL